MSPTNSQLTTLVRTCWRISRAGIYSHEAVLREYVQNAADAYVDLPSVPDHAAIQISIEGDDTISIQDNGIGMDEEDIKAAKKIAVSPKADRNRTGFRGIGIWAGFQACRQLEIVTTKRGDTRRYRLQIDFADILEHVDEDINIKDLLDNRFRIHAEGSAPRNEHYTHVRLIGLDGDYRSLADAQELRRIASQILPCKIDPQFEHAAKLTRFLQALEGYQEYSILVEGGEVFKEFPRDLEEPNFVTLKRNDEEYARIWFCTGDRSLTPAGLQYRNFRLRIRNFAVGRPGAYDDEDGRAYGIVNMQTLGSRTHLNWHVGEIRITNPEIRPDTPRSSLELDALSRRSVEEIRAFLRGSNCR